MRQEQPRAATSKRLQAAAAVRAGGGQQAASNEEQAASDLSRSSSPEEKQRRQVGPTSKNAVSTARSRAERPSDLNIEENPRAAGLRRRPELLVSTCRKKLSKVDFCSRNCSRERAAQWLSEKRLQTHAQRFRAAGSRNPRRSHEKTPGSQKPRHGHAKQGARQGGTEPGTTRCRDGRKTTRPPAPRWGPGAPTAELRPQGPSRKSAQI